MYAAIKTKYEGTQFRSRLEAKYAAFFDLVNLNWQYEPVDLNGWIPDFVIHGTGDRKLFVEIKPQTSKKALEPTFQKISRAIPYEEDSKTSVALLTPGFYEPDFYKSEFRPGYYASTASGSTCLGYIRCNHKTLNGDEYWDLISLKLDSLNSPLKVDFSDFWMSWVNRLSGEHNKEHIDAEPYFVEAGNIVQWKRE